VRLGDPRGVRRLLVRPEEGRYEALGQLGVGGAGEVLQLHDRALNRVVAAKVLHDHLASDPGMNARFLAEAQVVAQLEHPAIVPVHDVGLLADGRAFLTMKEIHGDTLRALIAELHRARQGAAWGTTASGWTLRRLIEALRTVCEAVAYAHARRVIHRDIKPDNVMVGDLGQVYVLDWGLAMLLDPADEADGRPRAEPPAPEPGQPSRTRFGQAVGTPAYMPPEQARGERAALGPWSDVWALGATLYATLYGRPPYRGESPDQVLDQVRRGPPRPVRAVPPPPELEEIRARCMAFEPADRYPDARAVAGALGAWLEGALARERALSRVERARGLLPDLAEARARALRAREQARARIVTLRRSDDLPTKEKAWALEDEAAALSERVDTLYDQVLAEARLALGQVPDLPEARDLIADRYRERCEEAEASGDLRAAREFRAQLAAHDDGRHAEFLRADEELVLITSPPGAMARVLRYELRSRRLQLVPVAELGPTPVWGHRLPVGSYLVELHHPDCEPVRYPIELRRGEGWRPVPPGAADVTPVALPAKGRVLPIERPVLAGWFVSGGDGLAPGALPRQRTWVPSFSVVHRPVNHQDYLAFINDLVASGGDAAARVPRLHDRDADRWAPLYLPQRDGRFGLEAEVCGVHIEAAAPVVGISGEDGLAYCRWLGRQTGLPWRPLGELEWEKAARGVDARKFPWGDEADPAFHCMQDSALPHPGPPAPGAYPVDLSPYGVSGMAGGAATWCAELHRPSGPPRRGSSVIPPEPPTDAELGPAGPGVRRAVRGGAWDLSAEACRSAARSSWPSARPSARIGLRIGRSLDLDLDPG
jgi:serine/threonine-protein kinase